MKKCIICGEEKPLIRFGKHKSARDGHRNQCKDCRNAKQRNDWYPNYKNEHYEAVKSWRARNPERVLEYQARYEERLNLLNKHISGRTLAAWARQVKKRDGFICTNCGAIENLHAHHILPKIEFPDRALDIENGITLCERCHIKAHKALRE